MKWNEVCKNYPNQFVKVVILETHKDGDYEVIDEVAVVRTGIPEGEDALKEFMNLKGKEMVYSTAQKEFKMRRVRNIGLRIGRTIDV